MNLKCGIIGLPNVGKSTLFNILTQNKIQTKNFPFCTIQPNIGVAYIPDVRIIKLAEINKIKKIIPATIQFVDIAGLVKNAHKGKGLGNAFLNDIRETKAICHVIRCFNNKEVIHIEGKLNPIRDIEIINNEIILFDMNFCEYQIKKLSSHNNYNQKNIKQEISLLKRCLFHLNKNKMLRTLELKNEEKKYLNYFNFITFKPIMYVVNADNYECANILYLNKIRNIASTENSILMIFHLSKNLQLNYCKKGNENFNIMKNNFPNIIQASYNMMNVVTFFTINKKEVKAWTIPEGTTALQASNKIHTDFTKGFIRAKIISFDDFIHYKSEEKAKEFGKIYLEGKNYIIKDGDIIKFLFNI